MSIFKNDSTSKLQVELDRLTKKRAALAGRLVAAESAAAAAAEARRRHLIESDDIDASAGVKFSEAVEIAQRDMTAISGAIAELDAMIQEGAAAVTAAKESAERAKRASEIEARIRKIEPLAAQAEKTFEQLASILEKIIETADSPDLVLREYRVIQGPGAALPAINLVSAALTEALFKSLPDAFAVAMAPTRTFAAASLPLMIRRDGGLSPDLPLDDENGAGFRPAPLSGSLSANLVDPLRAAVAEILDGTRPITSARAEIADDDDDGEAQPAFEHRRIVLTKSIKWIDWSGEPRQHPDGDADIPAPVAIAAKTAGVGFDHGSREGDYHLDRRIERGFHNSAQPMNAEIVDLRVTWPTTTKAAA